LNQIRKNLAICLTQDGINRANLADKALAILAAASVVDLAAVLSTLESFSIARSKLCEAVQLDPSNEHILKNLQSLEQNILQLKSKIPEQFRPPYELPISAGTLKLLQEGYAALENQDWDQAAG
jgi:predicted ATPase